MYVLFCLAGCAVVTTLYYCCKRHEPVDLPINPSEFEQEVMPILEGTPHVTIVGCDPLVEQLKLHFKQWHFAVDIRPNDPDITINSPYVIAFDSLNCSLEPLVTEMVKERGVEKPRKTYRCGVLKVVYVTNKDVKRYERSVVLRPSTIFGKVRDRRISELYQRVLSKPNLIECDKSTYNLILDSTIAEYCFAAMKSPYTNLDISIGSAKNTKQKDIIATLLEMTKHECRIIETEGVEHRDIPTDQNLAKLILEAKETRLHKGLKDGLIKERLCFCHINPVSNNPGNSNV